jgi:hypothetical protein
MWLRLKMVVYVCVHFSHLLAHQSLMAKLDKVTSLVQRFASAPTLHVHDHLAQPSETVVDMSEDSSEVPTELDPS